MSEFLNIPYGLLNEIEHFQTTRCVKVAKSTTLMFSGENASGF